MLEPRRLPRRTPAETVRRVPGTAPRRTRRPRPIRPRPRDDRSAASDRPPSRLHDLLVSAPRYGARVQFGVTPRGLFDGLTFAAGSKLLADALPKGFGQVDTLGQGECHHLFGQLLYCH